MTYPLKFRQHVLAIKEKEKLTYAKTASRFGAGMASLMRWNRRIMPCTTHNKPATKIDIKGKRYYGKNNWLAKGSVNIIGALLKGVLITLCAFQCNIDSDIFHAWINQSLLVDSDSWQ